MAISRTGIVVDGLAEPAFVLEAGAAFPAEPSRSRVRTVFKTDRNRISGARGFACPPEGR